MAKSHSHLASVQPDDFDSFRDWETLIRYNCVKGMNLYRGISTDHASFVQAEQGLAVPRKVLWAQEIKALMNNEVKKAAVTNKHNSLTTKGSPFTSWTPHFGIVSYFAYQGEEPGIVLVVETNHRKMNEIEFKSPDNFDEAETLLAGKIIADAIQTPVCPGTKTIFG